MISREEIERLSTRNQMPKLAIAREYSQNCFLSEFYRLENSDRILFKGGTALRLIYQSPRYSEDLDFTAIKGISYMEIENLIMEVARSLIAWGFEADITEAKETTGGYLAKIDFSFLDFKINLKIEISFRKQKPKNGKEKEFTRIKNEFIPHYNIYQLFEDKIVDGKISALLSRSKPRDWYDLYFLMRANMLNFNHKKKFPEILEKLERKDADFKKELKSFLPRSHHIILKDFKKNLIKEIKNNI